ncbi:MAG TPA: O-methyltransferase [Verrucomicrobiae bacterium]|nr:O-methyltransferase [Verrucomicrobiae bacterium]
MNDKAPAPLLHDIDDYIERLFVPRDSGFEQALREAAEAGLPAIQVSPNQGKLLYLLAKLSGAHRVLEIGLLGGYSTMWLARAVGKSGRIVTLEIDERCVRVARKNLQRAKLLSRVEIRHGNAWVILQQMVRNGEPPFDLVFIDADKPSYSSYLDCALELTRPGSLILADNVIRNGDIALPRKGDEVVEGIKKFNKKLAANPKLEAILIPVVRQKIDGLAIARVKD